MARCGRELKLPLEVVGLDVEVLTEAATREEAVEAARDVLHERLELGVGRWRRRSEGELATRLPRVPPVEEQDVEVHVQVQRRTEALHHRHAPCPAAARVLAVEALHRAHQHAQGWVDELRPPRQQQPVAHRHGQDPLADADVRQDAIDEVGGSLAHPASPAPRAEAASLAGHGDHPVHPTVVAPQPEEAVLGVATRDRAAKLRVDMARPAPVLGRAAARHGQVSTDERAGAEPVGPRPSSARGTSSRARPTSTSGWWAYGGTIRSI